MIIPFDDTISTPFSNIVFLPDINECTIVTSCSSFASEKPNNHLIFFLLPVPDNDNSNGNDI